MRDVSAGSRPPCWCPSRWAPAWRLHTNLYKFGENVSLHIFHKKNCCDLNLGESLCIPTFFLFPDSGLNLLNGFGLYFDLFWMAWHWKPAIVFTNPFKTGMSLDLARGRDSWCWPKGARPLGTRMSFRPPGFSPYMGREERRVQGLD